MSEPRLVISPEKVKTPRIRPVWIFDNMVGEVSGDVVNGETVFVYDRKNKFLGSAVYNEASRIRARLFSLERETFDDAYVERAITAAVERRRAFFALDDSYRAVFSDSDFLPGLIADRIGNVLVVQLLTLAIDRRRERALDALRRKLPHSSVIVRTDAPVRQKEGLAVEPAQVEGDVAAATAVRQDGFTVYADPLAGQKTGLFLDQRFNRRLIAPWCGRARVLDLFCYVGAWSFTAARAGAKEVVAVDSSAPALDMARRGAEENGFAQIRFECGDVFDYLGSAGLRSERYDVIVCDPPAFAKTRKQVKEALRAYLTLNYRTMRLLAPGGLLATSSCSQHVGRDEFETVLELAARNARMRFHVVARGTQAPDHPILPDLPESEYLKCVLLRRVQ